MRCLLVDDEPLARERLRALLREAAPAAEIVGEAANGREALALIEQLRPDVVFLDVHMPALNGFDVVELLPPETRPVVVFVTAFEAYAVRAFETEAVDYLTKPVRLDRLRRTLARLSGRLAARASAEVEEPGPAGESSTEVLTRLTVRAGARFFVVDVAAITRFRAEQKLVSVHLSAGSPLRPAGSPTTDFTLDALEARLPAGAFLRVHRSHLVNARAVVELVPWFAGTYQLRLRDGAEVPVSRRRVRAIRTLLGG